MPPKKRVQTNTTTEPNAERLTLLATTYGELAFGQRYTLIGDDDPLALRNRRRRSTANVDHALDIPVYTAVEFPKLSYEETPVKALLEAIETIFGSGTQRWRYCDLTKQLIVGLPQAPCNPSGTLVTAPPPQVEPEDGSVDRQEASTVAVSPAATIAEPVDEQPSSGVAEEKVKHTRIRWDDTMRKKLTTLLKKKTSLEEIAEAIGKIAGKPVTIAAIRTQAYSLDLGKWLPKK